MTLECRPAGLPSDISGRLGGLPLAVHPRAHELGFHLRSKLSRYTDRLEFRDRSSDRAHLRRMEYPPVASLRARRVFCPNPPCVGIAGGAVARRRRLT